MRVSEGRRLLDAIIAAENAQEDAGDDLTATRTIELSNAVERARYAWQTWGKQNGSSMLRTIEANGLEIGQNVDWENCA